MKIEFIKEEKMDGTAIYFTKVDGLYVDGSLELNEEKAKKRYEFVVKTKQTKPIETILDSTEI